MTTQYKSFLTDEVKALIGVETEWSPYSEPISHSEVRRFVHAIMDDNAVYYDEAYARGTKYGEVVCPPLYASFAFRRAHGTPDPLDRLKTDRDWDAVRWRRRLSTGSPARAARLRTHGQRGF